MLVYQRVIKLFAQEVSQEASPWKGLLLKGLPFKNRCHLGSRYTYTYIVIVIYIYIDIYTHIKIHPHQNKTGGKDDSSWLICIFFEQMSPPFSFSLSGVAIGAFSGGREIVLLLRGLSRHWGSLRRVAFTSCTSDLRFLMVGLEEGGEKYGFFVGNGRENCVLFQDSWGWKNP